MFEKVAAEATRKIVSFSATNLVRTLWAYQNANVKAPLLFAAAARAGKAAPMTRIVAVTKARSEEPSRADRKVKVFLNGPSGPLRPSRK
ncbi:hypothetical protein M885DRAFT_478559 [Pelagophyceae sp. CCMP2097]|nr:hypothetical protein M885DRAFT_478559 [Pelagophyceae sp. CCMP2097]